MNPYIERVAKEAGAWFPNGYPSGEGGDSFWDQSVIFSKPDLEKFTDMLIQECISVIKSRAVEKPMSEYYIARIKEAFGVIEREESK